MAAICILSTVDMPTRWDFPGHGLGKTALMFAENLQKSGHGVTLLAGPESSHNRITVLPFETEKELLDWVEDNWDSFDLFIDITHFHHLQELELDAPVINYSPDREAFPGPMAVFPTENHRAYWDTPGLIIPNAVDIKEFAFNSSPKDYLLYMAPTYPQKGFKSALHVARVTETSIIFAGAGTEKFPNGQGPVYGKRKVQLLQNAKALIFPSPHEAGPITVLEAQACGTPVLCYNKGGAANYVQHGKTGYCAEDLEELISYTQQIDGVRF